MRNQENKRLLAKLDEIWNQAVDIPMDSLEFIIGFPNR
jgi:hypothetical protein